MSNREDDPDFQDSEFKRLHLRTSRYLCSAYPATVNTKTFIASDLGSVFIAEWQSILQCFDPIKVDFSNFPYFKTKALHDLLDEYGVPYE